MNQTSASVVSAIQRNSSSVLFRSLIDIVGNDNVMVQMRVSRKVKVDTIAGMFDHVSTMNSFCKVTRFE